MPPQTIFDITGIDFTKDVYDQEVVRSCNPQRGDMEMLNGIIHVNTEKHEVIGYKNIGYTEFWAPGHIPGRPLFPGVLMIEAAAQLASFYARKHLDWTGFIGFGGVDECRFRKEVLQGDRLIVLGKLIWQRHRRINCIEQGWVNGSLVFETRITGVQM